MMNRKSKSNVKSFQEENDSLKNGIESIVHIDLSYLRAEDVSMYVYVQLNEECDFTTFFLYISTGYTGLHQGEWPENALHATINMLQLKFKYKSHAT